MQENGQAIPKTHGLLDLLALCLKSEPAFHTIRTELNILEGYAIQFRYPGQSADKIEAKAAYMATVTARDFIRHQLKLS